MSAGAAFGALAVALGLPLAAAALLCALLERRERREAWLRVRALDQFPAVTARSAVSVRVHCGLLAPRARVVVAIWPCPADELWAALARLRRALPAPVRLSVEGEIAARLPVRLTVDVVSAASRRGVPLPPLEISRTAA